MSKWRAGRALAAAGAGGLLALSGYLPGDPYMNGYIVDAGGVLALRGIPCQDGPSVHFIGVDDYLPSAVHDGPEFDGKPVWSARSKGGVGMVLLGDAEQPGLRMVRNGVLGKRTRYEVWYASRELGRDNYQELDLRIADLSDGGTSSDVGISAERELLERNPADFGCP